MFIAWPSCRWLLERECNRPTVGTGKPVGRGFAIYFMYFVFVLQTLKLESYFVIYPLLALKIADAATLFSRKVLKTFIVTLLVH